MNEPPQRTQRTLSPRLAALVARYRATAVVFLNLVLFLVIFNLLLGIGYAIRDALRNRSYGPSRKYPESSLAAVYPGWTAEQRAELLKECWSRHFVFADYIMFKEQPFTGKYVNVSPHGFRFVENQGPWPPEPRNLNVFVFGASATFGYGLPDDQTVASHLQNALARLAARRVCVYNFAVGSYYSTQERILLEKLLSDGHAPHLAIFIDGANDCESPEDKVAHQEMLEQVFNQPDRILVLGQGAERVPMIRLARSLAHDLSKLAKKMAGNAAADGDRQQLLQAIPRYRNNKTLIEAVCRQFSVAPVFVWQPVPGYQYDLKYHLFADLRRFETQEFFFSEARKAFEQAPLGTNFLWCADIQRDAQECLYVDSVHYTAKLSKQLAEVICQRARERGLFGTLLDR